MATKKKRPPRQVWFVCTTDGLLVQWHVSKRSAQEMVDTDNSMAVTANLCVVGPYVLAERVRQK